MQILYVMDDKYDQNTWPRGPKEESFLLAIYLMGNGDH